MKRNLIFTLFFLLITHFSLYPNSVSVFKTYINQGNYFALKKALIGSNLSESDKKEIICHAQTVLNDIQKKSLLSYDSKKIMLNLIITMFLIHAAWNVHDSLKMIYELHDFISIKKYLLNTKQFDKQAVESASIQEISERYNEAKINVIEAVRICIFTLFLGIENYYGYHTRKPIFILNFLKNTFQNNKI